MLARTSALALAGLVVALSASACGSSDSSDGGTAGGAPTEACTAATTPSPASAAVKDPLDIELLDSHDTACGVQTMALDPTLLTPGAVQINIGQTVAFVPSADIPDLQVGLEKPYTVKAGEVQVYRFTGNGRFYVSVGGSTLGEVVVGTPSGLPAPSDRPSSSATG